MGNGTMGTVRENLLKVKDRIAQAAGRVGKNPEDVKLVLVTKTIGLEQIREAIAAGVTTFGENYVQEARTKIEALGSTNTEWHFIGHLQTNKAKYAVRLFNLIHSVDSIKLARELDRRSALEGRVVDCLIEVNLAGESSKFGADKNEVVDLAAEMTSLQHLSLRGLMTMPPYSEDPESSRPYFIALRTLKDQLERHQISLPELSMGMSADFEVAIDEGATMVRVGRAIFGERG